MDREILFRGKRIDNGEWIEGTLYPNGKWLPVFDKDDMYIGNSEILRAVVPKTVGEYTGLTDKNGKKIFEGDIFVLKDSHSTVYGVVEYRTEYDDKPFSHNYICCGFVVKWIDKFLRSDLPFWSASPDAYVIGNIHDNPELLEGT